VCGRYVSVARVAELIEQYKATAPVMTSSWRRRTTWPDEQGPRRPRARPSLRDGGNAGGRRGAVGLFPDLDETVEAMRRPIRRCSSRTRAATTAARVQRKMSLDRSCPYCLRSSRKSADDSFRQTQ
jgi:hypothetical protein